MAQRTLSEPTLSSQIGAGIGTPAGITIRILLEVMGCATAVWGGSELFWGRDETNSTTVRVIAFCAGAVAFVRQAGHIALITEIVQPNSFAGGFFSTLYNPFEAAKDYFGTESEEQQPLSSVTAVNT